MDVMKELSRPFHPSEVSFKPGAVSKDGKSALALAYADPRVYMERLDELFKGEWEVHYKEWGERLICEVSLPVGRDWTRVTRSSTGEPDKQSQASEIAGTATEAQAFKRACVMFGLGRYLYSFPLVWVAYDRSSGFDNAGLNQLRVRLQRHYEEWGGPQEGAGTPMPEHYEMDAPPDEDVDYYPAIKIPKQDRDVVAALRAWAAGLDKTSDGKTLSEKQYRYLVSLINKRYETECHGPVLSNLVGREVSHESPPGWKIKEIIDWLTTPDENKGKLAALDDLAVRVLTSRQ